jgi:glycosyltransferase involved in cell wall biosynthesis
MHYPGVIIRMRKTHKTVITRPILLLPTIITTNGTAKQALELVRVWHSDGLTPEFVTFAYAAESAFPEFRHIPVHSVINGDGVIIKRLFPNPAIREKVCLHLALLCLPFFVHAIRRQVMDVLIANDWFTTWAGALSCKRGILISIINDVPDRVNGGVCAGVKLFVDRIAARRVCRFIVLDRRNKKLVSEWVRVPSEIVKVIRSGVNRGLYERFRGRKDVRREFVIPETSLVLVCANLPSPHRRYEDVLEAMSVLNTRRGYNPVHLVLLSRLSFQSEYSRKLLELAGHLDLSQHVHVVDRYLSDTERMSYLKGCDIMVFPNAPQTWGLTAIEAMALGVPAVVSDGSGVSEVLHHGTDALIFGARDVRALARAIGRIQKDTVLHKRLAVNGRKYVLSAFTWDQYSGQVVSEILKCLEAER